MLAARGALAYNAAMLPRALCLVLTLLMLSVLPGCGEGAVDGDPAVDADPVRAAAESLRDSAAPDAGPLVVFLGDSLSAGLGLTGAPPFPERAAELLGKRGIDVRIVNAGVSGDTTAGGLERLPWLLKQEPDIVVIELGANDALRGLPLDMVRDNLEQMVRAARAGGAEVLLLGMQIPPSYGRAYAEGFATIYGDVARDQDVLMVAGFLAGVGGRAAMNQADGLHPNDAGHRRLAENIVPALQALIEARP